MTDEIQSNETTLPTDAPQSDVAVRLYADIFCKLLASPRFLAFYESNFELRKYVDEEAKTVDYHLLELPLEAVAEATVHKITKLMKDQNKITLATDFDVQKQVSRARQAKSRHKI